MRIILDTDKKTITVPWNYADKLEQMKTIAKSAGVPDENLAKFGYKTFINDIWNECMANSDSCLKTGAKPFQKVNK